MKSSVYTKPQAEQEYETVGEPITISTKEPRSRDELRLTQVRKRGEDALRADIRFWTIHGDGTERAHRGGLQLTAQEAVKLRDALNEIFGEGDAQNG